MRKLYVLIRDDLKDLAYKAVQAGHAVAQFLLENPGDDWQNSYLIYVRVKDENQLRFWRMKLEDRGHTLSCFHEPDLGDEMTALACRSKDEKLFNKLQLLR